MPRSPTQKQLDTLLATYHAKQGDFELFRKQVVDFFRSTTHFHASPLPLIHSVKSRLKDPKHLREKIRRKWSAGPISKETLFTRITDFCGVRVLHLHSQQFSQIHQIINEYIAQGNWILAEAPIGYSWDPEARAQLERLGITPRIEASYYTSIHYVVKPFDGSPLSCEIQIRTLFEEAWAEIDHALNYPVKTTNLGCREQLRVLAKLASTGTRLADSIFKTAESS